MPAAYIIRMEVNFSELKQKDVINLSDGRHLGRVCDISFTFPENKVLGFTVTGCKGFRFSRQEIFIPVKNVTKIGEDAVLVNLEKESRPPKPPCPPPCRPHECAPPCPPPDRRSYDEYE